jgi:hypothetical protein
VFLGVVLVVLWSAAWALWSGSAPRGLAGDHVPQTADVNPWNSTNFLTVTACFVAAQLLLLMARTWWRGRKGTTMPWALVVVAGAALPFIAAFSTGLPGVYRTVMGNNQVGPAWPAAVGVWLLAVGAALAVAASVR